MTAAFKYTAEEMEEAKYEFWLMGDGPEKAEKKHRDLAVQDTAKIIAAGWKILDNNMIRESFSEFKITELVIRRGKQVIIIRWHTFNKGWMRQQPASGSIIWDA